LPHDILPTKLLLSAFLIKTLQPPTKLIYAIRIRPIFTLIAGKCKRGLIDVKSDAMQQITTSPAAPRDDIFGLRLLAMILLAVFFNA